MQDLLEELKLSDRDFKQVQQMIFDLAGISLADTKRIMVQGRLAKRVRQLQLPSYTEYLKLLNAPGNADMVTEFINALTTNKTEFFREQHHFDHLVNELYPELKRNASERRLRIWCAASSTGEEPYTLAMTVREFFGNDPAWDIRILASDIDTDVLTQAQNGVYQLEKIDDVPKHLIRRYFDSNGDGEFVAKDTLKQLITFRQINLQHLQWPIRTRFDIIFCRNVMIYFNDEAQCKILEHFGRHLKADGHLFMGHSESLLGKSEDFHFCGDTIYRFEPPNPEQHRSNLIDEPPGLGTPSSMPSPLATATATTAATTTATTATETPSRAAQPQPAPSKSPKPPHAVLQDAPSAQPKRNPVQKPMQSDPRANDPNQSITLGEVYVSNQPMWISTLLGSCVSVCMYDDVAKVGGINHFMLPEPRKATIREIDTNSYGVHSMELLINSIMSKGGDRRRLKAKVFGGGNVLKMSVAALQIGERNVDFAMNFLETEGIPVMASFTNQPTGMRIQFHTHTAKAQVKMLDEFGTKRIEMQKVNQAETVKKTIQQPSDITLF